MIITVFYVIYDFWNCDYNKIDNKLMNMPIMINIVNPPEDWLLVEKFGPNNLWIPVWFIGQCPLTHDFTIFGNNCPQSFFRLINFFI